MRTAPASTPRRRVLRTRSMRPLVASALAGLLLFVGLGGCLQQDTVTAPTDSGPRVLGLYEIEFSGIGSATMSTSVRRIDVDGEVGQSALGTSPIPGITFDAISPGREDVGDDVYAFFSALVTPPSEVENLTFVAFSRTGLSLGGSAFEVVTSDPAVAAPSITPAAGGPPGALSDGKLILDEDVLATLSTVAFSEGEVANLDSALRGLFEGVVDTVFPYGFVVTAADGGLGRTISGTNSGLLHVGFRVPEAVSVTRLVVWMAAVEGTATRIALPPEYNSRDAGGVDNLAVFAEHVAAISQANQKPVELVVLGEMPEGEDRFLLLDADDWKLGSAWSVELPWKALPNVRVAGGFGVGAGAVAPVYWLGGDLDNEVTPLEVAIEFKSTGSDYTFSSREGASVEYLVVAGGGGGGSPTANNQAGGGGGAGGVLSGMEAALCEAPCTITVGAGGDPDADGFDSVLGGLTAVGGGRGGLQGNGPVRSGSNGGSGGGGGGTGGLGTPDQGFPGGSGSNTGNARQRGGGGGGSDGAGQNAPGNAGGQGGPGIEAGISGVLRFYAAGGGGGGRGDAAGAGGSGVGGSGSMTPDTPAVVGAENTGSGGGGGAGTTNPGAAGGSGIVIVRYQVTP